MPLEGYVCAALDCKNSGVWLLRSSSQQFINVLRGDGWLACKEHLDKVKNAMLEILADRDIEPDVTVIPFHGAN
jgi:hypothetical protein